VGRNLSQKTEVTKSKEPTQGAKEEQKPELDSAIIDELMKKREEKREETGRVYTKHKQTLYGY
jgi:hypothetical protein